MPLPAAPPPAIPARPPRGYDARWWGDVGRRSRDEHDYWTRTRTPLASLCLVLPALAVYELGVGLVGGANPNACRTGLDGWIRLGLASFGLTDRWLPPLALICALLAWQAADRSRVPFRARCLAGMILESTLLASVLIGLSRVVDVLLRQDSLALAPLQAAPAPDPHAARLLGYLGAGIYEEAIFRLTLLPALLATSRALLVPHVASGVLAVTGSSLLFSLAHHIGSPGETFTWYAFIFRWFAGVFFAWVFALRGFGVAVGTHVAYDWLVALTEHAT